MDSQATSPAIAHNDDKVRTRRMGVLFATSKDTGHENAPMLLQKQKEGEEGEEGVEEERREKEETKSPHPKPLTRTWRTISRKNPPRMANP